MDAAQHAQPPEQLANTSICSSGAMVGQFDKAAPEIRKDLEHFCAKSLIHMV